MGFTDAIGTCLRKYAVFSGRASRAEFWWFFLFTLLAQNLAINIVHWMAGELSLHVAFEFMLGTRLSWPLNLVNALLGLPLLAVLSRRFTDTGRPPSQIVILIFAVFVALVFVSKLPIPGSIAGYLFTALIIAPNLYLLFVATRPSQPLPNEYGPNPYEVTP